MASFKWINSNLVMVLAIVCLVAVTASSGFPQKKRTDFKSKTDSKTNFWIIQSPKRPLPGLGIELPPASMLLMTIDPNATTIEPVVAPQQQGTTAVPTEEPTTSPGVDEIAITETLATSTVGTEAVTDTSIPTTTPEELVTFTEESSTISPETEQYVIITEDSVTDPNLKSDVTTPAFHPTGTREPYIETTTEITELSTVPTYVSDDLIFDVWTTPGSNEDGSGSGETTTESGWTWIVPEFQGSGSGLDGGSGDTLDTGSGFISAPITNDQLDVEDGFGTNSDDGSDAPPDVVAAAALLDSSVSNKSEHENNSDIESPVTEVAESEFLVFTTEVAPEDPGLGESTTETIELSRKNPEDDKPAVIVKKEDLTSPTVKNVANSRRLLTVDIKTDAEDKDKVTYEEVSQKSDDGNEEARQYYRRPYPIRPDQRPIRRPSSIDRHDQNFRPEYDDYDSNIIYRTYDYCFTLWCKFKTQLSRIGLL